MNRLLLVVGAYESGEDDPIFITQHGSQVGSGAGRADRSSQHHVQRGRELPIGREGKARGERRRCRRIDDEHAVRAVRKRAIGFVQDLVDLGRFARAHQADVVGDPDIRVLDVADIPGELSVLDAVAVALVPGISRGDHLDHVNNPSIGASLDVDTASCSFGCPRLCTKAARRGGDAGVTPRERRGAASTDAMRRLFRASGAQDVLEAAVALVARELEDGLVSSRLSGIADGPRALPRRRVLHPGRPVDHVGTDRGETLGDLQPPTRRRDSASRRGCSSSRRPACRPPTGPARRPCIAGSSATAAAGRRAGSPGPRESSRCG